MKLHLIIPILAFATSALADFNLPSSVFEMGELAEAKAKATEEGKPLIIVRTTSSTNWGPCLAVSSAAFKSFRKAGVVVYSNTKGEAEPAMPSGTRAIYAQAGATIPKIYVTSSDGSKGIKGIPYETLKGDMRGAIRELRKELEAREATTEEPAKPESQDWTNKDGKTITAAVKSVTEESLTFIMPNGKEVPYLLADLSKESRKAAEALR